MSQQLLLEKRPTAQADLPIKIPFSQVAEALRHMGLNPDNLASVTMLPGQIVVEEFRLDEKGNRYAARDELAKVVTTITVEREDAS